MAVWLDCRAFNKKPPLHQAYGFVIVNSHVHDDFDQFKKSHSQYDYSLLKLNELLRLWLSSKELTKESVEQYGKKYVKLHSTEIDSLCTWVLDLREQYYTLGESVFQADIPNLKPVVLLPVSNQDKQETCTSDETKLSREETPCISTESTGNYTAIHVCIS